MMFGGLTVAHTKHDDVIKWKHFPRNWPFVRGIHRSRWIPPHKGQWRGALMFSLICVWINRWVNNREAGDLRRYRAHYDVIVMTSDRMQWIAPGGCEQLHQKHCQTRIDWMVFRVITQPNKPTESLRNHSVFHLRNWQVEVSNYQNPKPNIFGWSILIIISSSVGFYFH